VRDALLSMHPHETLLWDDSSADWELQAFSTLRPAALFLVSSAQLQGEPDCCQATIFDLITAVRCRLRGSALTGGELRLGVLRLHTGRH
jgi:hypothetical protein